MGLLRWLDRVAGRVNKQVESTAVVTRNDPAGQASINTVGFQTGLDEVESETAEETKTDE
jgi:hypothetical protein